jgi:ATP-dependent Zn protease
MASDTLDPMNLPYHEAGHTLVGVALGRRLNYVSIEPGDQMSDFEALTGTDRASVELWIKTALGGPLAEQRRFGVSWGCKTDVASIRYEIATNLPGVEEIGYVGEVAKEVERLLTVHEEALHALARELFDRKRLAGDEVTKLVR